MWGRKKSVSADLFKIIIIAYRAVCVYEKLLLFDSQYAIYDGALMITIQSICVQK